jgi:hypothetical protein
MDSGKERRIVGLCGKRGRKSWCSSEISVEKENKPAVGVSGGWTGASIREGIRETNWKVGFLHLVEGLVFFRVVTRESGAF